MKFFDEAFITVQSGDGGRGCVSFRREKFIPRGGPDGGDGGKGGDVIFKSSSHRRTLYPFRFKRQFKAQNGSHGQGKQKTGKNGDDLIIEIPPGTLIIDEETNEIIKDFTQPDTTYIIAQGGRGGQGNSRFKTSTHRAPRFAQPGEPGKFLKLKLELKLLADVGLIGLPNAGKSTLISVISSATPKIADYPFTTLTPTLGVVQAGGGEPFVVADIPGLIEGAHQGVGLGTRFLRHIERTRVLVHLIDLSIIDPQNPLAEYETINQELASYSSQLTQKPQIVALNKMDIPGTKAAAKAFLAAAKNREVIQISAATRKGVRELTAVMIKYLEDFNRDQDNVDKP
ncbi:MAG: GTPase ObgE [Deltaproteobacteria bacterium]|nr:GTPase ObgE [Deltaproteobacteria bacterium]